MELVISIKVDDNARPDEIGYALRQAGILAASVVEVPVRVPQIDDQTNLSRSFKDGVACARELIFYRSE